MNDSTTAKAGSMITQACEAPSGEEGGRPAAAGGAAAVGIWAVQAAYYALVFWIPLETIATMKDGDGKNVAFSRLIGLLLFGLALLNWRGCFRRIPAAFWMVAWYLAAYTFSQLWLPISLDEVFRENQRTLIQMAALFLISANLFEEAAFRQSLLRFYGWWVSLVAAAMVAGAFGDRFDGIQARTSILGQDPNVAAGFFALGAICVAGDPWVFKSKLFIARASVALLAISTLIMAMLRTGSRGGLVVFASGIAGLAICGGKASWKRRVLIAGAVIGVFGLMLLLEFLQGSATASRLSDAWSQGDTSGRLNIYRAAWSMFLERPLLGFGGANNAFTLGFELNYAQGRTFYRDTHNLLLAVLTEVGLVGAVPFVAALMCALWKAWRYGAKSGDALPFALMCALIAINASLTGYHQKIFWIVLGAAVGCGLEVDAAGSRRTGKAAAEREGGLL